MIKHIRHGDVLLTKIDTLPEGKEIQHKGQHILAWGEVTGHAHRLTVKDKDDMKVVESGGITFISLVAPAPLTHEEHRQLEIPSGIWKLTFEREFDPCLESIRQVRD